MATAYLITRRAELWFDGLPQEKDCGELLVLRADSSSRAARELPSGTSCVRLELSVPTSGARPILPHNEKPHFRTFSSAIPIITNSIGMTGDIRPTFTLFAVAAALTIVRDTMNAIARAIPWRGIIRPDTNPKPNRNPTSGGITGSPAGLMYSVELEGWPRSAEA
jgi:hypothetical protein